MNSYSFLKRVWRMKNKQALFGVLLVGSMAFSLLTGCTNPTRTGESTGETSESSTLKIGFLCDITGDFSWYGGIMGTMGKAVVNSINNEGIKGFSKIEVKIYDTQSDQQKACDQVYKAKIEDGMDIVWGSWVEAELIPFIEDFASIPYVMNNPTGLKPLNKNLRWTINPDATSWDLGIATAEFFKKNGVKTWAITGQGWGEGWLDAWAEGIKYGLVGTDIACVWDKEVSPDKVDWTEEIKLWQILEPDALIIPNPGAGAFSIIEQMKSAGYSPSFIILDPLAGGDYSIISEKLGTDLMLNLIAPTNSIVESPVWKEFATKHLELDYLPYGYSAEIWDTMHLIKIAAEKIGPDGVKNPAMFAESLRNSSYNGAMGHTLGPFRENGLLQKVTVSFVKCLSGPPDWTDAVDFHWETVFITEFTKQLSLDEASLISPELTERLKK